MWYVILNPQAGHGQAETAWREQQPRLEAQGHAFQRMEVADPQRLAEQVAALIEGGGRRLLAIGGDGTHHHVVNGIMRQQVCPSQEIDYALWPLGSGNDWVRTHRIPAQADAWRRVFLRQRYRTQDVGLIEAQGFDGQPVQRYFANVAGLGYDALVAHRLQAGNLTQGGGLKYLMAVYGSLRDFEPQPLRITTEAEQWERKFYTLNLGICKYSGGGMSFVPQADPQDGRLALTLVKDIPPWRVAINTPWLYTSFFDHHPVCIGRQVDWAQIEHLGEKPIWIEAEGELVGQTPVRVTVKRKALRFVG